MQFNVEKLQTQRYKITNTAQSAFTGHDGTAIPESQTERSSGNV